MPTLHCLLPSDDWDHPVYKVLANNDTGNTTGHQGGVLIPVDLREFFPGLTGVYSADQPTVDQRVEAQLFVENDYRGTVSTRYQIQTWGGQRSPETRLTDQLGCLRNAATGGDVLVIQRSVGRLDYYRLTLIRKNSTEFTEIAELITDKRWGVLTDTPPVTTNDFDSALREEASREKAPFSPFDTAASHFSSTTRKVARSLAFRRTVLDLYDGCCAVCGEALRTPSGLIEVDAAHIVPRSLYGADDARNGFALCKRHHWAFDNGLFSIDENRKVFVPALVSSIPQNTSLKILHGVPVREASNSALQIHPAAIQWHWKHTLIRSE
ncbi:MAG: HNH endonuclease [Marinospirillum sp.]|nr:HNH endonuclease [Marinospirillum sp.]